jgi:hypothetical protein
MGNLIKESKAAVLAVPRSLIDRSESDIKIL